MLFHRCLFSGFLAATVAADGKVRTVETTTFLKSVVLMTHDQSCADSRPVESVLVDAGVMTARDAASAQNSIHALARAVKLERLGLDGSSLTKSDVSGIHGRRLSDEEPESRRDYIMAVFELGARKAAGVDATALLSDKPKLKSKYLATTKIDIVRDAYDLGDEFLTVAKSLPCLRFEPEVDMTRTPLYKPTDPEYSKQYWLQNGIGGTWAEYAWDFYAGAEEAAVDVAVVDTGCSLNPDLEPNIFRRDTPECESDIFDPIEECAGYDFGDDDPNPFDEPLDQLHGTAVSSCVAGRPNNGHSIAGLCWNCKIHCLKIWDSQAEALVLSAILEAHDYILRNGIKISNHSYGGYGESSSEKASIEELEKQGHLFIAAAGNDGCNIDKVESEEDDACKFLGMPLKLFSPAGYDSDNIVSVCATNAQGMITPWSNYGPTKVDLCAPGANVLTLWNTLADESGLKEVDGTSFSSPIVAGVAALIWGSNPDFTYKDVKNALMDILASPLLEGTSVTTGIVNVTRALERHGKVTDTPHDVETAPTEDLTQRAYDWVNPNPNNARPSISKSLWASLLLGVFSAMQ